MPLPAQWVPHSTLDETFLLLGRLLHLLRAHLRGTHVLACLRALLDHYAAKTRLQRTVVEALAELVREEPGKVCTGEAKPSRRSMWHGAGGPETGEGGEGQHKEAYISGFAEEIQRQMSEHHWPDCDWPLCPSFSGSRLGERALQSPWRAWTRR